MEKKIIKPKSIIYIIGYLLFSITLVMLFLFFSNIELGILFFILWLPLVCFFVKSGIESYHKDWIEITCEKVTIDQKVMKLEDNYMIPSKGVWMHQRLEIDPRQVSKIGYYHDLYGEGKALYYHGSTTCWEVAVEMKDGEVATFNSYFYTGRQLRDIIKMLSQDEDVLIIGSLKKMCKNGIS